jgi:hypothetical protein
VVDSWISGCNQSPWLRLIAYRVYRSQVGDIKQSDLPGIEALGREGD